MDKDEYIVDKAKHYDEIGNGHPCEACGLRCGCSSGGKGGKCIYCIYCNPEQEDKDN